MDEIQRQYLQRLKEKLWVIIESKELSDIKLNHVSLSHFYRASFTFNFTDGSHFDLESSIILNTSVLGRYYYQFPNLYKNVKFTDGTTSKFVPEATMVTEFAGRTREELAMAQKDIRAHSPKNVQAKKISHLRNTYNLNSVDGEFLNSTFHLSTYDDRIIKKLSDVKILKAEVSKPETVLVTFKDGLSFEAVVTNARFADKSYTRSLRFPDLKDSGVREIIATVTKVINEPQVGAEDAVMLKKAAVRIKANYGIKCMGRVMPGDPISTNDITVNNTISDIELIPPLPKPKLSTNNYLGTQVSGKALANVKAVITYTDGKTATITPKILRYSNIRGKNEWGGESIVGVGDLDYVSGAVLSSDIT